jgi:alanine-glyoxylate transaminase / serine-glyoxylate transaminase / serine-pyruvate transaminase
MNEQLTQLKETLLMGPGPSTVPPSVYEALAAPTIGHLDPSFIAIMDKVKSQLKQLANTENRLTLPMSGTGSAGMETCFVNLVEPGDRVLVLTNGVFGVRMQDVAARYGAEVDSLDFDWGTPVDPDAVRAKLSTSKYKIVALVHAETSTGVMNPASEIGEIIRQSGALYVLDTVTSLGGIPVLMDEWGVDALYSGTQKCLSCPPGLAPVSFSDNAVAALDARSSKVPSWYLDLGMIKNYWEGSKRVYHHTAPINMIYGLFEAMHLILKEGLPSVYERHMNAHQLLVDGLKSLGLEMLVEKAFRLPMLNAVKIPESVDEASVRSRLLNDHQIEIGAGLGPLTGKIWRVGIMGYTAQPGFVARFLDALAKTL